MSIRNNASLCPEHLGYEKQNLHHPFRACSEPCLSTAAPAERRALSLSSSVCLPPSRRHSPPSLRPRTGRHRHRNCDEIYLDVSLLLPPDRCRRTLTSRPEMSSLRSPDERERSRKEKTPRTPPALGGIHRVMAHGDRHARRWALMTLPRQYCPQYRHTPSSQPRLSPRVCSSSVSPRASSIFH